MTQVFARPNIYNYLDEGLVQQIAESNEVVEEDNEPLIDHENQSLIHMPFIGLLHFVRDKTGYSCSLTILLYWVYGNWFTFNVILFPHVADGFIHFFAIILYGCISALTIVF